MLSARLDDDDDDIIMVDSGELKKLFSTKLQSH